MPDLLDSNGNFVYRVFEKTGDVVTAKHPKIHRYYFKTNPTHCPVILQKGGTDWGVCAEKLVAGECPDHGDIQTLLDIPIPPEKAAEFVWLVRKSPYDGSVIASAFLSELEEHGLLKDNRVITPKGSLDYTKFKTNCGQTDVPLSKGYRQDNLRVILWLD